LTFVDATRSVSWGIRTNAPANEPSSDLDGSHTLSFEFSDFSSGTVDLDCLAPYDGLERFGLDFTSYDFDDSVDNNVIDGPQLYPKVVPAIRLTSAPIWHMPEATVELTIDDTGHDQAIELSNNDAGFVRAENTDSHTADFDTNDIWGSDAIVHLDLSRQTDDPTTSPGTGDAPQTLSGLELLLDTDDLPVITGTKKIAEDTYLATLQSLHNLGDMRFTIDHSDPSLVAESYRRGAVLQSDQRLSAGRRIHAIQHSAF